MATYAEYLAEEVQKQAAKNEGECYHDLPAYLRIQRFNDVIVAFCKKFNIDLSPQDR